MHRISYKVRIPYSGISELNNALNEGKVKAKVRRPAKAPKNRSQIVEIRVTTLSQGRDHTRLIEERIQFNNGAIAGKLSEGDESFWSKAGHWLSDIWLPSVLSYAAMITPVLTYFPVDALLNNSLELTIFLLLAIPSAIGIGTSHMIIRK